MSRAIVLAAPAKVNLTLEVLGKRADGFHELASVFATIDLRDRVRVAHAKTLDVRIAPPITDLDGDDLATRAVRALARAASREPAAHVRVRKRIPTAAGLGGGSSDAAAVLRALARLWRLDGLDLGDIGASLGSDVPFFTSAAPYALVRGRGERVEPLLAPREALWIALVRLRSRVSTAAVFASLEETSSRGLHTAAVAEELRRVKPHVATIREHLVNDLRAVAERTAPEIAEVSDVARRAGVDLAMSGSGPTLFALADDRADAIRIARHLRSRGMRARAHALGVVL
jgi:4-diphosphocytidyl-2-C-methyl-D-erythritol kinase